MVLFVPVSCHWRMKSAICTFFPSKLYILVTKHIKLLKILLLRLQWGEPKKLLREGVFLTLFF